MAATSIEEPSSPEMSKQTSPPGTPPSLSDEEPQVLVKDARFWIIIFSLAVTALLVTLEVTIVSTALPSIAADLGASYAFFWVPGSYLLSMTALQPLYGQLANIFGRRTPLLVAIALFMLGSGLSGGATDMGMLISGRTIQGLGGAGINVLVEVIVCDLVPVRERGRIMGIVLSATAVGPAVGPVIGGAITQHSSWRWVFYLNLPIAAVALALLAPFLRLNRQPKQNIAQQLARIDWGGNVLFIAACSSMLIAVNWAGGQYAWSSVEVVAPLVVGLVGLVAFVFFEGTRFAVEPTMPLRLFSNRTSLAVFIISFIHGLLTMAVLYYLPIYFQAVYMSSPSRSGVQMLPTAMLQIPSAIIGGVLLEKTGYYRLLHGLSFVLMIVGLGLFSILDAYSSTAEWVMFQVIEAAGIGLLIGITLPIAQAGLPEKDVAQATATWSFLRAFGMVWGTAISGVVFNNRFADRIVDVADPTIRNTLSGGKATEHATAKYMRSITEAGGVRDLVRAVYSSSLQRTWLVLLAFAGLGFLLVFLEGNVELRTTLDTEYSRKTGTTEKGEKQQALDEAVNGSA